MRNSIMQKRLDWVLLDKVQVSTIDLIVKDLDRQGQIVQGY